jgi:hypothetical protein
MVMSPVGIETKDHCAVKSHQQLTASQPIMESGQEGISQAEQKQTLTERQRL